MGTCIGFTACIVKSPLGPVDPSFRALSGRLTFTVRGHKFNKDSLFQVTTRTPFLLRCTLGPGVERAKIYLRRTRIGTQQPHMQTLIIYKLGFNQNYHTFTLMLLIKIVLCSECP